MSVPPVVDVPELCGTRPQEPVRHATTAQPLDIERTF